MQFQDLLTDTQTKFSDQTKYVQKNTNNYNTIPIKINTQKLLLKQKVTIQKKFFNKSYKTF